MRLQTRSPFFIFPAFLSSSSFCYFNIIAFSLISKAYFASFSNRPSFITYPLLGRLPELCSPAWKNPTLYLHPSITIVWKSFTLPAHIFIKCLAHSSVFLRALCLSNSMSLWTWWYHAMRFPSREDWKSFCLF